MKRGKAQYSVEFLVTYGWALLVIGVIVAAIYALGAFNTGDFLPERCEFFGQVTCRDFTISTESFGISVINNFGVNLNIG